MEIDPTSFLGVSGTIIKVIDHIPGSQLAQQSSVSGPGWYSVSGTTHNGSAYEDDGYLIVGMGHGRIKLAYNGKVGIYNGSWRDL